ncbi:hypothetical protein T265_14596, partial [Opisthorchis viverrini]
MMCYQDQPWSYSSEKSLAFEFRSSLPLLWLGSARQQYASLAAREFKLDTSNLNGYVATSTSPAHSGRNGIIMFERANIFMLDQ